jgi:hypothetical protein
MGLIMPAGATRRPRWPSPAGRAAHPIRNHTEDTPRLPRAHTPAAMKTNIHHRMPLPSVVGRHSSHPRYGTPGPVGHDRQTWQFMRHDESGFAGPHGRCIGTGRSSQGAACGVAVLISEGAWTLSMPVSAWPTCSWRPGN